MHPVQRAHRRSFASFKHSMCAPGTRITRPPEKRPRDGLGPLKRGGSALSGPSRSLTRSLSFVCSCVYSLHSVGPKGEQVVKKLGSLVGAPEVKPGVAGHFQEAGVTVDGTSLVFRDADSVAGFVPVVLVTLYSNWDYVTKGALFLVQSQDFVVELSPGMNEQQTYWLGDTGMVVVASIRHVPMPTGNFVVASMGHVPMPIGLVVDDAARPDADRAPCCRLMVNPRPWWASAVLSTRTSPSVPTVRDSAWRAWTTTSWAS